MTSRVWANGTGIAISAANMNGVESDLDLALGVPDLALAARVVAGTTKTALDAAYATAAAVAAKVAKGEIVLSVKDYGAVGDGVTNNNTALTNAVAAAVAQNATLLWPSGSYLVTVTIPLLHTVIHMGRGSIKRGSDVFYPEPFGAQVNILYVNPTASGVDTYDGLTAALPMKTTTSALLKLANYGPIMGGLWTIQLSAGTYPDTAVYPTSLFTTNAVTIKGPAAGHPNVPTAIFTKGYNITANGLNIRDRKGAVIVQDILFTGYNGSVSSCGIEGADGLFEMFTVNCHFTDCYWGVSGGHTAYDVKGGIFTRCGYLGDTANNTTPSARNGQGAGTRSLMLSRHEIGVQNAGNLNNGPYYLGCYIGAFVQESCTGHMDYCRFEDCNMGMLVGVNSRVNLSGSSFKRNNIDIRATTNSVVYVSSTVAFGTGADESGIKCITSSGAMIADESRVFTNIIQGNASAMKIAETVFPGTTVSSTGISTVYTATLGAMFWRDNLTSLGSPKRLNIKVYGTLNGTTTTKAVSFRFGTMLMGATFVAADVGAFEAEATIFFTGQATQIGSMRAYRHLSGSLRLAAGTGTNALTGTTNLTIEGSVGATPDSILFSAVDLTWA